jgi:hypothetical protein
MTWKTRNNMTRTLFALVAAASLACGTPTEMQETAGAANTHVNSTKDVVVVPDSIKIAPGETKPVTCEPRNSLGQVIVGRDCKWQSLTPSVVTIGPNEFLVSQPLTGVAAGTGFVWAQNGGHRDTVKVVVAVVDTAPPPPPPPPPPTGTVFFSADAESGTVPAPFSASGCHPICPLNVLGGKNGARAWRFEVTNPAATPNSSSALSSYAPQKSMGCILGHYCGDKWYSFWYKVEAGYDAPTWNAVINFLANKPTPADPTGHLGLSIRGGVRRFYWYQKNCEPGTNSYNMGYRCPVIPGYGQVGAEYYTTTASPSGIVPVVKGQWIHVAVRMKFARTNGHIEVWQDGQKVFDLTHPDLNTFDGNYWFNNTGGDHQFFVGLYHGPVTEPDGRRRVLMDDVQVTDFRPLP